MPDHERQYLEVDPYAVAVSDMNERRDSPVTSSIQESIAEQGVIQPPLVRERDAPDDAEVPYEVVVGQRRVLGAQATAGVDSIPVVVVGWDDAEALEASITENIDAFSEDVSPKDRAEAVIRLMEMQGYNQREASNALGIDEQLTSKWLEYGRSEWEDTSIHVDSGTGPEESLPQANTLERSGTDRTSSIQNVRRVTGGGSKGVEMLRVADEHGLNQDEVLEATKRVDSGSSVEEAIKSVASETVSGSKSTREHINITFSGDEAEALETAAKQWGATENQVARKVILRYLDAEGFLEESGGGGS